MIRRQFFVLCLAILIAIVILPSTSALTVTTTYSANWSGYVATAPAPFTSVSATWAVPSVTAASTPAFSAIWTGIGGWYRNGNKLIQAGTAQDVLSSGTRYTVWYEVYPKAPVTVGTINVGDSITVNIFEQTGKPNLWHITIYDNTNSTTLLSLDIKLMTNFAAEASAEFIVERPLLVLGHQLAPLADFGTVTLSSCTVNSFDLSAQTTAFSVTMTSDGSSTGTILAAPSALSGNSFSDTWYAST